MVPKLLISTTLLCSEVAEFSDFFPLLILNLQDMLQKLTITWEDNETTPQEKTHPLQQQQQQQQQQKQQQQQQQQKQQYWRQ